VASIIAVVLSLLWLELLWLLVLGLVGYALLIREERRPAHVLYYLVVYLSSWLFFLRGFFQPIHEHKCTGGV
jgi:O-antigen/teichoic acid export membrane protein